MKNTIRKTHSQTDEAHSHSIQLIDITPIANRTGTRSHVVMTARAWSNGFAPDPRHHSLNQQIEMRTTAPQLRAMVRSLLSAMVGEDRVPCHFGFTTESDYLPARSQRLLGVAVNRNRQQHDFLVLHPNEAWFADFVVSHWFERWCSNDFCCEQNHECRFEPEITRLLSIADPACNNGQAGTEDRQLLSDRLG